MGGRSTARALGGTQNKIKISGGATRRRHAIPHHNMKVGVGKRDDGRWERRKGAHQNSKSKIKNRLRAADVRTPSTATLGNRRQKAAHARSAEHQKSNKILEGSAWRRDRHQKTHEGTERTGHHTSARRRVKNEMKNAKSARSAAEEKLKVCAGAAHICSEQGPT